MREWTWLRFDEAIQDLSAGSPKVKASEILDAGCLPVVDQGASAVVGYVDDLGFEAKPELPVIVFGDHTRRFKYVDFPFCVGADGVKLLRPRPGLDARFAFHYLRTLRLPDAGYSRHFKFLRRVEFPFPPLAEQRRIAAILDHADSLRAKRRRALDLLDTLTQSIFINMFGEVEALAAPWPRVAVGDAGRVQLGRQRAPRYQAGVAPRPYLRVANVQLGYLDLGDVLEMDFEAKDFARYELERGDILLNEGQNTELVGRPAMWNGEILGCCFQNTLLRFQCDRERVEPAFALSVFLRYLKTGRFARISSKTSNVAHLGAARFASLDFPLPPLRMQQDFVARAEELAGTRIRATQDRDRQDALFASLQHRAFRGEL